MDRIRGITSREQFRDYRARYLKANSRDRGGAWNRHAISASRLSDQLTIYGREMVGANRCTVTQAVEAMPDTITQRRLADAFYWLGTREEWLEALRAIDFGDDYEPAVSPRDCAIGGEEDSSWT